MDSGPLLRRRFANPTILNKSFAPSHIRTNSFANDFSSTVKHHKRVRSHNIQEIDLLDKRLNRCLDRDPTHYPAVFQQLIRTDPVFDNLLEKVYGFYNSQVEEAQAYPLLEENSILKRDVATLSTKIDQELSEVESLKKRIRKVSLDNERIRDEINNKRGEISDKIESLDSTDLSQVELSRKLWETLRNQVSFYAKAYCEGKKKYKETVRSETKLSKLLMSLKCKGVPIEEIYLQDVYDSIFEASDRSL